ncbi:MAG: hypothetical protein KC553_09480, partial [Nitrospina sp.]|nr:hypothetical protein [Nitrospina sp.]
MFYTGFPVQFFITIYPNLQKSYRTGNALASTISTVGVSAESGESPSCPTARWSYRTGNALASTISTVGVSA